jgi:putative membrane protein
MTDRVLSAALLAALVFALALPGYTQSNPPQGGTPQTGTHRTHTGTYNTDTTAKSTPIAKAIEVNEAEVELGKIALSKAENARVKDFASMMVKDHSDALNKLRALQGAPSDVKLNARDQQTADRLSKLSGAEFDREYMRTMVTDHQAVLRFLARHGGAGHSANANPSTSSKEFASVAQELFPTVQHHLQQAQEIQRELQTGSKPNKQTSTPKSTPYSPDRSKPSSDDTQK